MADAAIDKPKDRWFDPFLLAKGQAFKAIIRPVIEATDRHCREAGLRRYKRGAAAQQAFEVRVAGVVANLAYAVLKPGQTGNVAVLLRNLTPNRYDNPLYRAEHLKPILEALDAKGLLALDKGEWRSEVTTISPTALFASEIEAHGIGLADFARDDHQEVLVVTRTTKASHVVVDDSDCADTANEAVDPFKDGFRYPVKPSRWIDYVDDDHTRLLRSQVKALGRFLDGADISYIGSDDTVDVNDRLLRRHFSLPANGTTPCFTLGGRLFCRGLSVVPKTEREHLRIDGMAITTLDYSSMFPRLAYAMAGAPTPSHDLYEWHGLKGYRRGAKLATNAMLFGGGRGRSFPADVREALPKGYTPRRFREAFSKHHMALLPLLRPDAMPDGMPVGYHLMHTESRILLACLERLMALGIVAIGMHDGMLVGERHEATAKGIMQDVARDVAGVAIPVEVKA